jgi:hypothetical protein
MIAHAPHLSPAPAPAALSGFLRYGHHHPRGASAHRDRLHLNANRCEPAPGDGCGPWLASRAGPARGLVGRASGARAVLDPGPHARGRLASAAPTPDGGGPGTHHLGHGGQGPGDPAQPGMKPPGAQAVEAELVSGVGRGPLRQAGAVRCSRRGSSERGGREQSALVRFGLRSGAGDHGERTRPSRWWP